MSDWLFLSLLLLAVLSLPAAVACAVFFYRRGTAYVGWFGYNLLLLISAVLVYLLGLSVGIDLACVRYPSGNLCGLFGFLVSGPLASSLAIVLGSRLMTVADREPYNLSPMADGEQFSLGSLRAVQWYFSQNVGNLLTVPLFLFLTALFGLSLWGTLVQLGLLIAAFGALYGGVGIVTRLALTGLWGLVAVGPPVIYFLLLTYPAVAWTDWSLPWLGRLRNILFVLLMGWLTAQVLHTLSVRLLGWIIDHHP